MDDKGKDIGVKSVDNVFTVKLSKYDTTCNIDKDMHLHFAADERSKMAKAGMNLGSRGRMIETKKEGQIKRDEDNELLFEPAFNAGPLARAVLYALLHYKDYI